MDPGSQALQHGDNPPVMLKVAGLRKAFKAGDKHVTAIDELSLEVRRGEFVAIVGPSGCGKSTLLHIVGGFEGSSAGEILLNGRPVCEPGPDRGMMFQDFSLFPWLKVAENVAWPLDVRGVKGAERKRIVDQNLRLVNLERFADSFPAELSGGMKQRVALARLLALDPEIMLMDEPFGALDAQTRELMQEELHAIWLTQRKTVLFVTHDIEEAIFLGTRLIVFTANPGRIKADIAIEADVERDVNFKKTKEFMDLRNLAWDLLREEVLKAREGERVGA